MRDVADSRPPVAWPVVLPPAAVTALVLTLGSAGYGYHRDELYFRMLPPAWGYTDQPPLAPFLARASSAVVDEVWALRVPATLAERGSGDVGTESEAADDVTQVALDVGDPDERHRVIRLSCPPSTAGGLIRPGPPAGRRG